MINHSHEPFNTGNKSERATQLQVTTSAGTAPKTIVFSQKFVNLKAGDIIQGTAYGDCTNDLGYNVMLCSFAILSLTPDGVIGLEISEAGGGNISTDEHHKRWFSPFCLSVAQNYDVVYLNVCLYAASTRAGKDAYLRVDQDYGALHGVVTRFE